MLIWLISNNNYDIYVILIQPNCVLKLKLLLLLLKLLLTIHSIYERIQLDVLQLLLLVGYMMHVIDHNFKATKANNTEGTNTTFVYNGWNFLANTDHVCIFQYF